MKIKNFLDKWYDVNIQDDGPNNSLEYLEFQRDYRNVLKNIGNEIVSWRNAYYLCAKDISYDTERSILLIDNAASLVQKQRIYQTAGCAGQTPVLSRQVYSWRAYEALFENSRLGADPRRTMGKRWKIRIGHTKLSTTMLSKWISGITWSMCLRLIWLLTVPGLMNGISYWLAGSLQRSQFRRPALLMSFFQTGRSGRSWATMYVTGFILISKPDMLLHGGCGKSIPNK